MRATASSPIKTPLQGIEGELDNLLSEIWTFRNVIDALAQNESDGPLGGLSYWLQRISHDGERIRGKLVDVNGEGIEAA
jgi:hypothetical protein